MSGPTSLPTLLNVRRTDTDLEVTVRLDSGEVERWVFGVSDASTSDYRAEKVSHSLDGSKGKLETVIFLLLNKHGKRFPVCVETDDLDKFLPELYPPGRFDDMPVLMSSTNAAAPRLAAVELGEDAITLELHYPASEVGIFKLGFRGRPSPYRYQLVETVYTTGATGDVPMFGFVAEFEDGKRYRWYVHAENPVELYKEINAHMEAKESPKHEAADFPNVLQQAA